jgi:hypothetical protein
MFDAVVAVYRTLIAHGPPDVAARPVGTVVHNDLGGGHGGSER